MNWVPRYKARLRAEPSLDCHFLFPCTSSLFFFPEFSLQGFFKKQTGSVSKQTQPLISITPSPIVIRNHEPQSREEDEIPH